MRARSGRCGGALLLAAAAARGAAAAGCNATRSAGDNIVGARDESHFACATPADCAAACCGSAACDSYTHTTYQPHASGTCAQGGPCCWLKSGAGTLTAKDNCTSGRVAAHPPAPATPAPPHVAVPALSTVRTIATDPSGNLRDPSAPVQDPTTGLWHFWVVYIPGATQPGWHGYLHHYRSKNTTVESTEWEGLGLALNHSADQAAYDCCGMFSPSAIYDGGRWWLFYSGTAANYSETRTSAQLVAEAASPEGPWTRRGVVARPLGSPPDWSSPWNARRLDSGRAMIVGGQRGYWTKGVRGKSFAQEGLYLPQSPDSFMPPYTEWAHNPVFPAANESSTRADGYENCEFFMGPAGEGLLHVICQSHNGGQPHWVTDPKPPVLGMVWRYVGTVSTKPALEPTPVYEGGPPGDGATVRFFIARTNTGVKGPGSLAVALYRLAWT